MSIFFDTNYIIPNNPTGEDLAMALATVINNITISFEEASKAVQKMAKSLQDLENRTNFCENEILYGIRPVLDAFSEKPNQKSDLEISGQKGVRRLLPIIEDTTTPIDTTDIDDWYENFLRELNYE